MLHFIDTVFIFEVMLRQQSKIYPPSSLKRLFSLPLQIPFEND